MKNRGAESLTAMAERKALHEAYKAAGWVMVMGPKRMRCRMVQTGKAIK